MTSSVPRISQFVTSSDGTRLYVDAVGATDENIKTKPTIVFIHGFSMSGLVFDTLFEDQDWIDAAVLVKYDVRGHGRSDKPTDKASWESKRLAEDFDAVVEAFKLVKPFVIGWSLGGTHIADILSLHPPTYLQGIAYLSAIPYIDVLNSVASPISRVCLSGLTQTTDVDLFQKSAQDFVDIMINDEKEKYTAIHQIMLGNALTQPRTAVIQMLTRDQDPSGLHASGRAGLPLLVIYNKKDRVTDSQETLRAVSGWKDMEVAEIEEGDHMPWMTKDTSELLKKAILDWVGKKYVGL